MPENPPESRLYGLAKHDIAQHMDDVIGLIDIREAIDDRVESYSGGMRRRIDLALSLVHRPQVLFLDEPTTVLDTTQCPKRPTNWPTVWASSPTGRFRPGAQAMPSNARSAPASSGPRWKAGGRRVAAAAGAGLIARVIVALNGYRGARAITHPAHPDARRRVPVRGPSHSAENDESNGSGAGTGKMLSQ